MRFQFLLPVFIYFAATTALACSEAEEDPTELIMSDAIHFTEKDCVDRCPMGYARHGQDNCEQEYIRCHTFTCFRQAHNEA
ncbi:hypothetical protein BDB00DRAFT_829620 [Zychaea mexicana]|uniref:uncharacterized protein n=1 Tax=Zychaea mexicana TaxID=64656 RepID=UPI0022FE18BE|nr:uncharacterized protein BDB00DRAFT_829620 [Zychaea mexicana]KAI9492192.1 hypothetical protein BDB00DRAFT_829620 [Zychaea mexicana]